MSRKRKKKCKRMIFGGKKKNFLSSRPNMNAWRIVKTSQWSEPELELTPLEIVGKPGPTQVLVKLKAAGVNPCDHQMIYGSWPIHEKFPWIPGVDGAGEITEVGSEVNEFRRGDRVMFFTDLYGEDGTFAEYTVIESHLCSKIPDSISFEEAGAIPCAGFTSYIAINRKLRVSEGDTILIHSASGGTGNYAVQFAKAKGARVIATCSRRNVDFVMKTLGADEYILYDDDIVRRVMELTNFEGVDMIYNTYSSSSEDLQMVKNDGQIAFIAGRPNWNRLEEYTRSISLHEVYLGSCFHKSNFQKCKSLMIRQQRELSKIGDEIMKLMEQKKVKSFISAKFPLDRLKEALDLISNRKGINPGKIIISM